MAQESVKAMEETGCPPPDGPVLCANNCGFFGSIATMNFCSKCYKDHMKAAEGASSTPSTAGKTDNEATVRPQSAQRPLQIVEPTFAGAVSTADGTPAQGEGDSSSIEAVVEGAAKESSNAQGPKRCFSCSKRVGLTGFQCRCGNMYCAQHRYSDKHECSYDYKSAGREAIAQANPVVKADKIDKL